MGVTKSSKTNYFGVELPAFDRDWRDQRPPKCATSKGTVVLLREDIDSELVASKLYAYVCQVLFGKESFQNYCYENGISEHLTDMKVFDRMETN